MVRKLAVILLLFLLSAPALGGDCPLEFGPVIVHAGPYTYSNGYLSLAVYHPGSASITRVQWSVYYWSSAAWMFVIGAKSPVFYSAPLSYWLSLQVPTAPFILCAETMSSYSPWPQSFCGAHMDVLPYGYAGIERIGLSGVMLPRLWCEDFESGAISGRGLVGVYPP